MARLVPLPPRLRLALLLAAAVAACSLLLVRVSGAPLAGPSCVSAFPRLCKFVDDLRPSIPEQIDASTGKPIRIGAYQIRQKLHRDLPPTKLYAYGRSASSAHYPGPTLVTRRGVPSQVVWENHLTDRHHMFPVDYTLEDVPRLLLGGVPIVTHRHGGEQLSCSDGHPEAWFTRRGEVGRAFSSRRYSYPNHQLPTTLWYHDHTIAMTRLNVAAGLAGFFILTDPKGVERTLGWLPSGEFSVPLALADRRFHANGSIDYPTVGVVRRVHAHWVPEYIGDTILVTGKVWPYLNVRRALYRFRVLGAANARFFNLRFVCTTKRNYPNFAPPFTGKKLPIIQIGSDGGYLPRPVSRTSLLVAPAERHDILVDFSALRSSCADVILTNDAPAPFPAGEAVTNDTAVVMRFIVDWEGDAVPAPRIPRRLVSVPPINTSQVVLQRWIAAIEESDPATGEPIRLTFDHHAFMGPPTETPREGSEELWHVINMTPDAHPIHLHLIQHRPVSRRPFDVAAFTGGACSFTNASLPSCFTGREQRVAAYERGWKDTTILPPGHVLTLWTPWYSQDGTPFPFDATLGPGYVWHCHIVEHEDNEMMRPLILTN
ncbi:hypothetical protein CLOM_g7937 [Closterium sp. NIES-68]|nr:hypothetical protein CLOM_g7937 [Closterium sp. NIES-68]GJP74719.1 hypothetical protein CLOP_g5262 [Closterium sp. NIES-67]GJP80691.1 hypothetical protein CLOP_g10892 [Closterium sp. NIES-67]